MNNSHLFRRTLAAGSSLVVGVALAAVVGTPSQAADGDGARSASPDSRVTASARKDNLPNPLAKKQAELRRQALEAIAHGKAEARPQRAGGSVVELASGESVELFDNKKQANVWTVLSEFGDELTASGDTLGPRHNEMAEPDRTTDNSTQWTEDFDVAHYDAMFNTGNERGESFRDYYLDQSNGQYTATVTTEDWVQVPKHGQYYGDNAHEAEGYWAFVNDTVDAWYAEQQAAGKTDAEIASYLSTFDQWDRYDFNGNGNFNEPDGYIDHFQAIHAGAGEEAGGGALGDYAIWSHRWYADYTTIGSEGPTVNGAANLLGGQEIGNTGTFVGDYTVEPENGGLGVFAHEYAHDLGLPDFYDTSGGENSTAFWTLMSSGSWLGHGENNDPSSFLYGIGGTPNDMGPEEKLFLGWLDPQVVDAGQSGEHTLRAAGQPGTNDAVQVLLPDVEKTRNVGTPYAGTRAWYSDAGDDLNNTLTRQVVAAQTVNVDAMVNYDTETDYDYWYAQYSTDGGNTWSNLGEYTGTSGGWVADGWTYQANGQASMFRFVYKTDGGVSNPGVLLDEVVTTVDGTVVDTDGAETDTSAWVANGWLRTTGQITETFPRYYLMENRSYAGYDQTLQEGPYNFGFLATEENRVEHFPYQNGLLVWYVNHSVADNNTSRHPGSGYALPVDAMPEQLRWSNGSLARNRIQAFDSTFGLERTDRLSLHRDVVQGSKVRNLTMTVKRRQMAPTFTDAWVNRYWTRENAGASVKVAGVGVTARVLSQTDDTLTVRVVNP